jgi:hypothetical protein
MKKENYSRLFIVTGIAFLILYVIVMIIEIVDFSPYNKRLPFFIDRALEFLLPSIVCFVIAHLCKKKIK